MILTTSACIFQSVKFLKAENIKKINILFYFLDNSDSIKDYHIFNLYKPLCI